MPKKDDEIDDRFTIGLISDVFRALERHGYACRDDDARGHAVFILSELVRAYEGQL